VSDLFKSSKPFFIIETVTTINRTINVDQGVNGESNNDVYVPNIISIDMNKKYKLAIRLNCSSKEIGTNETAVYLEVQIELSIHCFVSFPLGRASLET